MSKLSEVSPQISIILKTAFSSRDILFLSDQINDYKCDFLADLLLINTYMLIGYTLMLRNVDNCVIGSSFQSTYKLNMGHIHTLVLTREWIARLYQ